MFIELTLFDRKKRLSFTSAEPFGGSEQASSIEERL
jgi:hypothetical protein